MSGGIFDIAKGNGGEWWTNNRVGRGRDERDVPDSAECGFTRQRSRDERGSATITEMVTRGNQVNWQIAIDRPLTAQGTAQITSKISLRGSLPPRFAGEI